MPGMSTNSKHTPTPNNENPEEIRSRLRAEAKKGALRSCTRNACEQEQADLHEADPTP